MARDRQRAKQRRAERRVGRRARDSSSTMPRPRSTRRASPRPARCTPTPAGAATAAPRSSTDELGDDRDASALPTRRGRRASRTRDIQQAEHPRRKRGRVITFLGHCIDELRRVQWPNRRQVGQATAVVLGFVVIAGGYLGLLDALWQPLIEAIL